jgi:hypothetical protein
MVVLGGVIGHHWVGFIEMKPTFFIYLEVKKNQ